MNYQYSRKDKVCIIKMDHKVIPIMISNKKNFLIDYMKNIRKIESIDYAIFLIEDIIKDYPNLFDIHILGSIYNIEDYIMANECNSCILPSIDISIINSSYKEAIHCTEETILNISKTIIAIESTNSNINDKLLSSLKESKNQLVKTLSNRKKMDNVIVGYEYSNTILSCNIYEYLNIRDKAMSAIEMTKHYKDICNL